MKPLMPRRSSCVTQTASPCSSSIPRTHTCVRPNFGARYASFVPSGEIDAPENSGSAKNSSTEISRGSTPVSATGATSEMRGEMPVDGVEHRDHVLVVPEAVALVVGNEVLDLDAPRGER